MAYGRKVRTALMLLAALVAACGSGDVVVRDTTDTLVAISVTPAGFTAGNKSSQQFVATGIYSNNTTREITSSVTWETSNANIAVVSNTDPLKGLATFIAPGSATITATREGIVGSATATVTTATLVSLAVTPNNTNILRGANHQFTATGVYSDNTTQNLTDSVIWSSSDLAVALVSNAVGSQGVATAIVAGMTTITATTGGVAGTAMLTVAAASAGTATLTWNAPTTYTDGTPIMNLGGFRVYCGTAAGTYTTMKDVGNVTTYTINGLTAGTPYYFSVTAYDTAGAESDYSNEISKMIL